MQPALLKGLTSLVLEVRERQIENEEDVQFELPDGSMTHLRLNKAMQDGLEMVGLRQVGGPVTRDMPRIRLKDVLRIRLKVVG